LRHAGVRQIDIGPTREAVFQVPGGFTVANQNERVHAMNLREIQIKKDSRMTLQNETG
jgi:hypothetical protein